MTFTFGTLGTVLGCAVLAAALFLLHRLRVRHRPVVIETSLFWRQAHERTRARVLVERFRHPWTFVLLLLIAGLLWMAFCEPRLLPAGDDDHVVLVDGSAAMAAHGRFDRAKAVALAHAARLPRDHRTVVLCQAAPETVLRPGEALALLERRLADRRAAPCPSTIARTLRGYGARGGSRPLRLCIVGDAPLDAGAVAGLPEHVTVVQLPIERPPLHNRGIVAFGARPADSGLVDAVDVLVEVVAAGGAATAAPALVLDGVAMTADAVVEPTGGGARYRFRDVTAHGGTLRAALPGGDDLAFDDAAELVLPDRRPIGVAVGPDVPALLHRLIAADPGLRRDPERPAVVIRTGGSGFGDATLPAIELVGRDAAEHAFVVVHPDDLDPHAVLHELYDRLGLAEIDGQTLAEQTGRDITIGPAAGAVRQLRVWDELLADRYDFASSRAFPLFFGLGIRWLVDDTDGPSDVAVGSPVELLSTRVERPDGRRVASLTGDFVPTDPGVHVSARGERFSASLLDPSATGDERPAQELPRAELPSAGGFDTVTWMLLAALLLSALEWGLYRRGRIA